MPSASCALSSDLATTAPPSSSLAHLWPMSAGARHLKRRLRRSAPPHRSPQERPLRMPSTPRLRRTARRRVHFAVSSQSLHDGHRLAQVRRERGSCRTAIIDRSSNCFRPRACHTHSLELSPRGASAANEDVRTWHSLFSCTAQQPCCAPARRPPATAAPSGREWPRPARFRLASHAPHPAGSRAVKAASFNCSYSRASCSEAKL